METAVIVIGRNTPEGELEHLKWSYFISDLLTLIKKAGGEVHTQAEGTGFREGEIEVSYIVNFAGADLEALENGLVRLAYEYTQRCIALIIGTCKLVPAWTS